MKTVIAACVLALAGTAHASKIFLDFAGPFAVTNWNFATTDDGTVDTSGAPASIVLTGGDSGSGVDSTTDFTIQVGQDALISFSWSYETEDDDAFYDPFGYLLGAGPGSLLFTQLTADGTTDPQSGVASVFVQLGETFGFRGFSIGSEFGSGTTTIGEFRAVVPEPSALALVSLALLVGATLRRGRRQ
jgi:hypothetical protein